MGVTNTAIGQFHRLMTLGDVELLASLELAHKDGRFAGHGDLNIRGRGSVGFTEE
jgi:hypothetical protein